MIWTQVYIGVTDHLWERHCQKDFRNARLEEYESWREMYLRLSEERERKLKQLTKSIVSAHSGKPKGSCVCVVTPGFFPTHVNKAALDSVVCIKLKTLVYNTVLLPTTNL